MFKIFSLVSILFLFNGAVMAQNDDDYEENRSAEEIVTTECYLCHGNNGEGSSSTYPRLAGQHREYIAKQLLDFRNGKRKGIMNDMVSDLTNEEIFSLAEYFNAKPTLSHPVQDKAISLVGQYIFSYGNKFSGIEACATCHGKDGAGTKALPRLAGQHKQYVISQLKSFNSRQRNNAIMHSIASKLTELEREAVAIYVSGL
jgi:cytochrome c553